MGKARRQKQAKLAEHKLKQALLRTNEKTQGWLGGILRRKSFAVVASAVGIVGSIWMINEVTHHIDKPKPYSLEMIFCMHDGEERAQLVLNEIDASQAKGKPIQIIFEESAFLGVGQDDWWVKDRQNEKSVIYSAYQQMRNAGLSQKDAELQLQ